MGASANEHFSDSRDPLRRVSTFANLPTGVVRRLESRVEWIDMNAGESFASRVAAKESESYYFIGEGHLAVVLDPDPGSPEPERRWEYLSLFVPGDFLSDDYVRMPNGGASVDCVAMVQTRLVRMPGEVLAHLMKKQPTFASQLRERSEEQREQFHRNRPASQRMVLDFFLRHGYSFAKNLKVVQLDRCINCDACEEACAERHGTPRLARSGPGLGGLSFPIACRACEDARCLAACSFGAISRNGDGAVVINKQVCAGCTACKTTCPNDVIEMVETPYTVDDFPKPMPDTDGVGETNIPGLFLIGEAGGAALIKLSINAGVTAVDEIAKRHAPAGNKRVGDVIVVGAGPAGLSAALACRDKRLSYRLFDKGSFATTIHNYPRNKVVMAEPAHLPLYGKLWLKDTTREKLLEKWQEIVDKTGLKLCSSEAVTAIRKESNDTFTVITERGEYRAYNVVVAVGTRGSPRKLGVEGETPDRVEYVLSDASEYASCAALVVGGGDSAVEAAMSLADAGARVTLSYRRDSFSRIKARNTERFESYVAAGKIKKALGTTVEAIEPGAVRLAGKKKSAKIENDIIFAMLGAEPPTRFFESIGIEIVQPGSEEMARLAASRGTRFYANKCDGCVGHSDRACIAACPTTAMADVPAIDLFGDPASAQKNNLFSELPFVIGIQQYLGRRYKGWAWLSAFVALIIGGGLGLEIFMRVKAPELSLQHRWLERVGSDEAISYGSGFGLGLTLGIIGFVLMVFAGLYPLNSRLGWFKNLGKKRIWMAAHIWAGVLGPVLVTYHTAFKLDRWASIAFWAAWIAVVSGFTVRFIQSWFKRGAGLAELEMQSLDQERQRLFDESAGVRGRTRAFEAADFQRSPGQFPAIITPVVLMGHWMLRRGQRFWLRYVVLGGLADKRLRASILQNFIDRSRAEWRRTFADGVTRSATFWRRLHLIVSLLLFAIAALHVTFGLLYMAH